ncbi:MAG TPA: hypothetical protein VIF57_19775 [Polyangia bacterium]|jgi:hypothetical protein
MTIMGMLANALGRLIAYIPNIIAAAVVLVIGFAIAKLFEKLTHRGLAALARRRGARQLVDKESSLERMPHAGGRFAFWVLGLITIGVAVEALNLPWLTYGVGRVIAYVPRVIAAGLILAAGYFGGNFLYRQIAAREGAQSLLGRLVRAAVYLFAGFMALHELGIATAIVTTAFVIVLGAIAVAGALSFGLGNRELAGRITRDWYEQRRPTYRRFEPTTTSREEEERRNPTH